MERSNRKKEKENMCHLSASPENLRDYLRQLMLREKSFKDPTKASN